jgi:alkylation response protein AidB-like acyl-CoA dehydrogenase
MDLNATVEQQALRESLRGQVSRLLPSQDVATVLDDPLAWAGSAWPQLAAQGWLGVSAPEWLGGAGLGLTEEAVVAEEIAAALLPVPFHSAVALALPVLLAAESADDLVEGLVAGTLIATLGWAENEADTSLATVTDTTVTAAIDVGGGWTLDGRKRWVPDGDRADIIIVPARTPQGNGLFALDVRAPGVMVHALASTDAVRPLADLHLLGAAARLLVTPAHTDRVLDTMRTRGLVLAAAAGVGITQRVLELTASYVTTRQQFGRPIGSYQAVSHQVADIYVHLELSRSLVLAASLAADEQRSLATVAAAAAAASKALPTAVSACETAIQLHGGVGVTWESVLHRYLKHAMSLEALCGPASLLREVAFREMRRDTAEYVSIIAG